MVRIYFLNIKVNFQCQCPEESVQEIFGSKVHVCNTSWKTCILNQMDQWQDKKKKESCVINYEYSPIKSQFCRIFMVERVLKTRKFWSEFLWQGTKGQPRKCPMPCALTPCLDETTFEETVAFRLSPGMAEATALCYVLLVCLIFLLYSWSYITNWAAENQITCFYELSKF